MYKHVSRLAVNISFSRYNLPLLSFVGVPDAHTRLEKMREQAPKISDQLALLATEKGSKWIRAQIGPFANKEEAVSIRTELREIFTVELPTVSAPGIVHQPGFELEDAEWYNWQ